MPPSVRNGYPEIPATRAGKPSPTTRRESIDPLPTVPMPAPPLPNSGSILGVLPTRVNSLNAGPKGGRTGQSRSPGHSEPPGGRGHIREPPRQSSTFTANPYRNDLISIRFPLTNSYIRPPYVYLRDQGSRSRPFLPPGARGRPAGHRGTRNARRRDKAGGTSSGAAARPPARFRTTRAAAPATGGGPSHGQRSTGAPAAPTMANGLTRFRGSRDRFRFRRQS